MGEIKLKPCPFCGEKNVRLMSNEFDATFPYCVNSEEELDTKYCYVHCYGCDMDYMPDSDVARDVMKAWNKRADRMVSR